MTSDETVLQKQRKRLISAQISTAGEAQPFQAGFPFAVLFDLCKQTSPGDAGYHHIAFTDSLNSSQDGGDSN